MHDKSTAKRGDGLVFAGLLILLIWLPLPWGSNPVWAKSTLVIGASTLLGLWFLGYAAGVIRHAPGHRPLIAPLVWWTAWLLWLGSSLVPWPADLLSRWAPEALRLQQEAANQGIALRPITSITPSATFDALTLSLGYACLYFITVLTCHGAPERARKVLMVLVISGLVQALYGSLMVLSGIEWGVLEEKRHYRGVATGTFVNRNHLAGYLELCCAAALGLILSELSRHRGSRTWRQWALDMIALAFSRKVRVRLALVIMAVALVMTRSRMGNIAFLTALAICGFGYILLRHRDRAMSALILFSSVILIDLLIIARWYGLEQLVERIEQTDFETDGRSRLLETLPAVIDTYWPIGSGLDSFATAYAPFHLGEVNEFFRHAHNDYLQFLIETGVPGVALLAIFVLIHVLHALRILITRRSPLPAAVAFTALMSIAALTLHSLTDFNLQIPANAASLLILLALSAGTSAQSQSRRSRSSAGPEAHERLDSTNINDVKGEPCLQGTGRS